MRSLCCYTLPSPAGFIKGVSRHSKWSVGTSRYPASHYGFECGRLIVEMTEEQALIHRRLWWHSRRGMLELDVLLVPYTESVYPTLGEDDQRIYRRLIDNEDQDLWNWFLEKSTPEDPEMAYMVRKILDRVQPD